MMLKASNEAIENGDPSVIWLDYGGLEVTGMDIRKLANALKKNQTYLNLSNRNNHNKTLEYFDLLPNDIAKTHKCTEVDFTNITRTITYNHNSALAQLGDPLNDTRQLYDNDSLLMFTRLWLFHSLSIFTKACFTLGIAK